MVVARAGNQRGVGDADTIGEWFNSLPIITRYWFGASMILTLTVNFEIISVWSVIYSWDSIKSKFELWRILSPFCYAGSFSFNTLITLYMLVTFSKQYEAGIPYNTGAGGGTADYAFCLLFGMLTMLVSWLFLEGFFPPIFCRNLIIYVVYIWSKRNPTAQASIWVIPVPAAWLPFAYLAFDLFTGGGWMDTLHGIVIGHLYYFLASVVPMVYGKDVLQTPQFLIDYFGIGEYRPEQPVNNPYRADHGGGFGGGPRGGGGRGGHNWGGGGRALGTQ